MFMFNDHVVIDYVIDLQISTMIIMLLQRVSEKLGSAGIQSRATLLRVENVHRYTIDPLISNPPLRYLSYPRLA